MSGSTVDEIVSTWFGAFRVRNGEIIGRFLVPSDSGALAERLRLRREGERTPEENAALAGARGASAVSWDRRLGLPFPSKLRSGWALPEGPGRELHRTILLAESARRLAEGWDPSIHVEEAVRTIQELDHTLNLVGERLVSWAGRDAPPTDSEPGAAAVARRLRARESAAPGLALPEGDPALREARADLAELYEGVGNVRQRLEAAIEAAMPRRAPNLSALLGPILAAKIVSLAGGLDRLARLPASTVQMLGAENAFFEHLRGRAPPPRHGVLFLHPDVQGAPKRLRGKLARALAGKAAIAARLDQAGAPIRADIIEAFRRRAREVRAAGPGKARPGSGRAGPLKPST
jgi:nucleolar protein 56